MELPQRKKCLKIWENVKFCYCMNIIEMQTHYHFFILLGYEFNLCGGKRSRSYIWGREREEIYMEPEKMVWDFKTKIINEASESKCPEKLLSRRSLITAFWRFARTWGKEETEYYLRQYEEKSKHDRTLKRSDYTYYFVLHFEHNSDVAKEYLKLKAAKEMNERTLQDNQRKFEEKLQQIGGNREQKKDNKTVYLKNRNKDKLKALKEKDNRFLIKAAWENCDVLCWPSFFKFLFPIYMAWEENSLMDEVDKILLSELPGREFENRLLLKEEHADEYARALMNDVMNLHIAENVLKIVRENIYVNDRWKIISTAIELFKKGEYFLFVYLITPQIEGLFKVLLRSVLKDNSKKTDLNNIVKEINKKKELWEYAYFAYDFPQIRNHIAHGDIIEVDTKLACEILMDLNWVLKVIDSEEQDYKKFMAFLNDVSTAELETLASRLNYYFSFLNNEEYCGLLERYLKGEFDDVIQWYQLSDKDCEFKKIIQSDEFYLSIWNKDPLFTTTVEKVQVLDGSVKDITVKHYSESLQYEGMVQLLYRLLNGMGKSHKYKPVPLNWYEKYSAFVKQANEAKHDTLKKVGIDPDAIEAEVDKLMEQKPKD